MAAILEESTEECNNNRDENTTDTLAVQRDKWSTLEIIKLLAKGGGKEAEAQFLFAYNVALSADPTKHEKMKINNRVSPADCANALEIAFDNQRSHRWNKVHRQNQSNLLSLRWNQSHLLRQTLSSYHLTSAVKRMMFLCSY
jgi:hypothetical protein